MIEAQTQGGYAIGVTDTGRKGCLLGNIKGTFIGMSEGALLREH